jgi:uncharacterized protein (DUF1501 family)
MTISRRNFLAWSASVAVGAGLTACDSRTKAAAPGSSSSTSVAPTSATTIPGSSSTAASTSAASTTIAPAPAAPTTVPRATDRVLVVVQLSGGNDGINTLIPVTGRYHDLRPTLGIPDDQLVKFSGVSDYGLHPSFAPMQGLLDNGRVAAVASVGYPTPNRSHFVSLDNWWSATPGKVSQTGWLGRYLDVTGGTANDPLRAVALGSGVPALRGVDSRATVVISPDTFKIKAKPGSGLVDGWKLIGGPNASAAVDAVDVLQKLSVDAAANQDATAEEGNITKSLGLAAEMIIAKTPARVIHISTGGFDTHANQLETQAKLLSDLATGLQHFNDRLTAAGMADHALVMTTSEFGRRAAENGSGTDHGKASVEFLVGPMVKGGVIGKTDLVNLDDGDLKADIDFRSIYTSALNWLGGPSQEILLGTFEPIGLR